MNIQFSLFYNHITNYCYDVHRCYAATQKLHKNAIVTAHSKIVESDNEVKIQIRSLIQKAFYKNTQWIYHPAKKLNSQRI